MEQRISHKGVLSCPVAVHGLAVMRDLKVIVALHENRIGAQRGGEAVEDVKCSSLGRKLDAQMRCAGLVLKGSKFFRSDRARIAGEAGGERGFDDLEILALDSHDQVKVALGEASGDSGRADVQNLGRRRKGQPEVAVSPSRTGARPPRGPAGRLQRRGRYRDEPSSSHVQNATRAARSLRYKPHRL